MQFINNKGTNGTVYSDEKSKVIFASACHVTFIGNTVTQCGAAMYSCNSQIIFIQSSNVTFNNNAVSFNSENLQVGGNIFSTNYGHVIFDKDSVTMFTSNSANFGAAIFSLNTSRVSFIGRARVTFNNNKAHYCGILTSALFSSIIFNDSAEVIYNNNTVSGISNSYNYYESLEFAGQVLYVPLQEAVSNFLETLSQNLTIIEL